MHPYTLEVLARLKVDELCRIADQERTLFAARGGRKAHPRPGAVILLVLVFAAAGSLLMR